MKYISVNEKICQCFNNVIIHMKHLPLSWLQNKCCDCLRLTLSPPPPLLFNNVMYQEGPESVKCLNGKGVTYVVRCAAFPRTMLVSAPNLQFWHLFLFYFNSFTNGTFLLTLALLKLFQGPLFFRHVTPSKASLFYWILTLQPWLFHSLRQTSCPVCI